ncbi:hypothetical protein [Actinoplanes sp. M2I2]|uniref:hypothetical protein n=1 Tax=Actinoplanes sp. M2I2 TaxID=1734444 RepID=UPI0020200A36|nr:hypothetical protein [Actinoplanes sp. M2I2]
MDAPESQEALRWLAERGVIPVETGRWRQGDVEQTTSELAHEWAAEALTDDRLTPEERLRIGFGLLDLLDEYWVTRELGWFVAEHDDPALVEAFWAACRQRLEAVDPCEPLSYSLWVDWFEDRGTAESAFSAVLGHDIRALRAGSDLSALTAGRIHRRSVRILECSGPVPWASKSDVYEVVAAVPELWPALFKGLLSSYHDLYGDLEPTAALALLDRLQLPPDTEHLATLRAVLQTGARNHYHDPAVWKALSNS